ncbi:MAG: hypothetical protein EG825_17320 [Rhodocyclaceae bacterium]|nr:hypothetical protein [Rhodocyclaceae bacterium]
MTQPESPPLSTNRRLLRALALRGHPKISSLGTWLFLLPQLILNLYLLGPVFVYYTQGVPPKENLEVITGVTRTEGKLGSNSNGLIAPHYVIDTESGPREVHCGFPMQRRLCDWGIFSPEFWDKKQVRVYYDDYFGILAYDRLEPTIHPKAPSSMSYEDGVYFYAQAKHTIRWNYHAHVMLPVLLLIYGLMVYLCWRGPRMVTEMPKRKAKRATASRR